MTLCHNESEVNINERIDIAIVLVVLVIVLEKKGNFVIGNSVPYVWSPRFLHLLIILLIKELPTQQMIFINGDYSRDQILPEHVAKINPLIKLDKVFTTFNSYTMGNVGSGIDTSNSSIDELVSEIQLEDSNIRSSIQHNQEYLNKTAHLLVLPYASSKGEKLI